MVFNSIDELMNYTKKIKGKTFKDFDKNNKLNNKSTDKGALGKVIETGFYGYPNNNIADADFNNLGIELKVTGFIKNKNGTISAKERLVLNQINYNSIINEKFEYSKLLFKNKKLLIIWYEYEKGKNIKDYVIKDYQLYDMSGDELIIKNDFEIIKGKVINGLAHLLSEGDTSYLGACTKAADASKITKQPNSSIPAKPRAFSLKNSYLTGILRSADLILEADNIEYKTIEEYVYTQIQKFIGKSQLDIYYLLTGDKCTYAIPKNLNKMISDRVIGKDKDLKKKSSLFLKTEYIIKNLPIDKNGYPLERMAFKNLRLSDFDEEWDNSNWKTYFEEITILILCYEGNSKLKNGFRVLKDIKKISFNDEDIKLFGKTYNMLKKAIFNKNVDELPYPNSFKGQMLEIAPKGKKDDNAYFNVFKGDMTKICFMLNKTFLFKKLQEDK